MRTGLAVGASKATALVGADTRTSSQAVKQSLVSGLLAAGCRVHDCGTVPTPTLAYCARDFQAGVMVTASHNPPEYNGLKLWNPDGSAYDAAQRKTIERLVLGRTRTAPWQNMRQAQPYPEAVERHLSRVLADFPGTHSVTVVVDCGCGAGSAITPYLLQRMGCNVVAIDSHQSGFFPRNIEPVPDNLANLARITRALGADLGLAHDADADRLTACDEHGRFISGDKLMVLLATELGARSVVTTVDASMAVEGRGFTVRRTRVGDAYVSEMLRKGGDFGGEPSGAWIFPKVSLCPDGVYAAALMVKLACRGKMSQQVKAIRTFPVQRGSSPGDLSAAERVEKRLLELDPTAVSHEDGTRLSFPDGWLLVRPSGTEPRIRITSEAVTRRRACFLYQQALAAVREAAGDGARGME